MTRIIVLGGGFAGLWAGIAAARLRDEIGADRREIEITLIDRHPYHSIRVRNYEVDLSATTLPLAQLLEPVGVDLRVAAVEAIDVGAATVTVAAGGARESLGYDRLVLALGSEVPRPDIPGLARYGFDVDTHDAAVRLRDHLAGLGRGPAASGSGTVVVVGAGFTGIEVATEMPDKLAAAGITSDRRVILVDSHSVVGATIGEKARPVLNEALAAVGVETRLGVRVNALDEATVTLSSGEIIPCRTLVWCAGMRASPLTSGLSVDCEPDGRIAVDPYMRVKGLSKVFAAGDVASAIIDDVHATVMSCQFARPMGRFAGHNAVADLVGRPMLPLRIDWYVTVLDLGGWGALYTDGWDRVVRTSGAAAKTTKRLINQQRIYPPLTGRKEDLFAAAEPSIPSPPKR